MILVALNHIESVVNINRHGCSGCDLNPALGRHSARRWNDFVSVLTNRQE